VSSSTDAVRAAVPLALPPAASSTIMLGGQRLAAVGAGTWQYGNQLLWNYSTDQDAELRNTFEQLVGASGDARFFFDTADSCAPPWPAARIAACSRSACRAPLAACGLARARQLPP
jgi:hypothetical protein